MAKRKLPDNFVEEIYISGFLDAQAVTAADYGYSLNHVPKTSGKVRSIKSSYDLAKENKATA